MHLRIGSALQGGKYRVEQVLGQGGFGITYLAIQVGLNRKVAIKEFFMKDICNRNTSTSHVSVPSVGSKELVEKFKKKFIKEAQTIAELDNNHIIRIHDIFEENGTAYYVMEYLGGGSLSAKIPSGGVSESPALLYIRQLCDALAYIHSKKILHLDIKPTNVLFRESGDLVLIDFGISKHYDDAGGGQTSSTPVGISDGYAPTEQYEREGVSTFSASTDIYALGATLYCLLQGVKPPKASIVLNDGLPALPAAISAPTRNVVEQAMQPKRKDRPQSVEDFLKLLDGGGSTRELNRSGAKGDRQNNYVGVNDETLIEGELYKRSTDDVKYNWLLGGITVSFEILFAFIMKNNTRSGGLFSSLDIDGIFLAILYVLITLVILVVLVKKRNAIRIEKWNVCKWTITIVCLINSFLLPMWNGSLTASYFLLSCGLAIVSGYTFLIKQRPVIIKPSVLEVLEVLPETINGLQVKWGSGVTSNQKDVLRGLIRNMVSVQGGTFMMGANEYDSEAYDWENPRHSVTLSSYRIGKYEVTQREWVAVMGSNPSRFKGYNLPVEQVSWKVIDKEFLPKLKQMTGLSFRLPTEAEWEYAARGGNRSIGYKYSGGDKIGSVAWCGGNKTHPVGQKTPNELGLYDMSGNVYEWCSDWYGGYSSSSQTNPQGPSSGSYRVCRGSSWFRSARSCRVSYRDYNAPSYTYYYLGLRLAL